MPTVLERVSKITEKGQTTVPKPVREALGVRRGDSIAYRIEGQSVTLHRADQDDPVVGAFLDFLAKDLEQHPETITAFSPTLRARIAELVEGVEFDTEEEIEGDVDL